jgi:hypothetical protein
LINDCCLVGSTLKMLRTFKVAMLICCAGIIIVAEREAAVAC